MTGDYETRVLSNAPLAEEVRDIWVQLPEEARLLSPKPGQFAHIQAGRELLRRPISIAGFVPANSYLRLIIRKAGKGTDVISRVSKGETLKMFLPLGNPFPLDSFTHFKKIWLAGGGIGVAPLLYAAKSLKGFDVTSFLGFRDVHSVFGVRDFEEYGKTILSVGGLVTEKISEMLISDIPDVILSCGPTPMLAALQKICAAHSLPGYVSLEGRMGCGVGACLVCNCRVISGADADAIKYKRVCRDGPVFDITEVVFQ
jgi:dihydroorotate dehydrogenase electron transfer subunit